VLLSGKGKKRGRGPRPRSIKKENFVQLVASKFMVETNLDRRKRKKKWVGVEFIVVVVLVVVVVVRTYIIVLRLA
jgi:hypothetical protein